jgi:hypothetical protein
MAGTENCEMIHIKWNRASASTKDSKTINSHDATALSEWHRGSEMEEWIPL